MAFLDPKFVLVGSVFNLVGSATYATKTVRGQTKPNRVSWFLWAAIPMIAFAAEVMQGVGWQSIMTLMVGVGPLLIFVASFVNKSAFWKLSRLDIACGVLSVVALISWRLSGQGDVAIMLSLIADALAGVPTLIKCWTNPATEHEAPFLCGAASAGITLLTIRDWNFATYGFPVYIFSLCLLLVAVIKHSPSRRSQLT